MSPGLFSLSLSEKVQQEKTDNDYDNDDKPPERDSSGGDLGRALVRHLYPGVTKAPLGDLAGPCRYHSPACDLNDDDPQQGCTCREAAIEAYHPWQEAATLPTQWRVLAAQTEIYPERNVWYLEEIARLAGDERLLFSFEAEEYAVVLAACNGKHEVIAATGSTPDEIIEALYQRVYEWACKQQTLQQIAS